MLHEYFYYNSRRSGGFKVSPLASGSSSLGCSPGWGHDVVFLGTTLYSHGASLGVSPPR